MNMRQILTGEPIRLRYIKRFSICPRVHEESVAEHSYYVAFIAMMIATDLKKAGHKIDLGLLLSRALIHDLDEVFSGDFIRMFKHDNRAVKDAIDKTSHTMMLKFTAEYPAGITLMRYWKDAKDSTVEGCILAFADFLSVVSYIWQEIHAGNVVMYSHLPELFKFSDMFNAPEFSYLQSYHKQVVQLLKEIKHGA